MNTYFYEDRHGCVAITADSPEEALELLRKYEGESMFLITPNIKAGDFFTSPKEKKVFLYHPE